jgi:hypothetical protein
LTIDQRSIADGQTDPFSRTTSHFMPAIAELTSLVDCAVVLDGGTIIIILTDGKGGFSQFKINRRMGDRGTPAFNRVSNLIEGENHLLSDSDSMLLLAQLQGIFLMTDTDHQCRELLTTFVQHLSGESAS